VLVGGWAEWRLVAKPGSMEPPRPLTAQPGPDALHLVRATRAHRPRRVRVDVLGPTVVHAVVVGPKEGGDHRTDRPWGVAERLVCQHRGELHYARALVRGGVASGAVPDCLVADRSPDRSYLVHWMASSLPIPSRWRARYIGAQAREAPSHDLSIHVRPKPLQLRGLERTALRRCFSMAQSREGAAALTRSRFGVAWWSGRC
jgi:hypothetical protein